MFKQHRADSNKNSSLFSLIFMRCHIINSMHVTDLITLAHIYIFIRGVWRIFLVISKSPRVGRMLRNMLIFWFL
jgi:hypothetical protein